MSRIIITLSQPIFFRLLAHAPEDLQREAKEDARRAIPAFCLMEEGIREKFAQVAAFVGRVDVTAAQRQHFGDPAAGEIDFLI